MYVRFFRLNHWLYVSCLYLLIGGFFQLQTYFSCCTRYSGNESNVIICADSHTISSGWMSDNKKHTQLLFEVLEDIPKNDRNTLGVIVEDMNSYEGHNAVIKSYHEYLEDSGVARSHTISGILSRLEDLGFETSNVEFRFAREVATMPLLDIEMVLPGKDCIERFPVSCHEVIQELKETADQIERYQDGPGANAFYQLILKDVVHDHDDVITKIGQCSGTLKNFMNQYIQSQYRISFLETLMYWDASLLDVKIIHEILRMKNSKKNVVVLVGAAHAERVHQVLCQNLGYRREDQIGCFGHGSNTALCTFDHLENREYMLSNMKKVSRSLSAPCIQSSCDLKSLFVLSRSHDCKQ